MWNAPKIAAALAVGSVVLATGHSVAAQDEKPEGRSAAALQALATALDAWREDFDRKRFELHGTVELARHSPHRYVNIAQAQGLFAARKRKAANHLTALQTLLTEAERSAEPRVVAALLPLASLRLDSEEPRVGAPIVRDTVQATILRLPAGAIWTHLSRVARAAGDGEVHSVADREAVLRVFGLRREPAIRAALDACLADSEPRIRIAAAEALGKVRSLESLPRLARALAEESHPVASQALLEAGDRTLRRHFDTLAKDAHVAIARAALGNLGRAGWRNDLATVRFLRKFPVKSSVPTLIELLRQRKSKDPLLAIVNQNASPILAHEAWLTLRRITGAILPKDPKRWSEFWAKEKDRIEMAVNVKRAAGPRATQSKGTFFGIPVVGREVVFIIDTSRSMRKPVQPLEENAGLRGTVGRIVRDRRRRSTRWTRLDAAKEQVLIAVAGLPTESRYRIVSFESDVRKWQASSVRGRSKPLRGVMRQLQKMEARGFTNTYEALRLLFSKDFVKAPTDAERSVDEVFFLSDGEPSEGLIQSMDELLKYTERRNRYQQIRINTVFTGRGKGAELMRRLAEKNHGVFVHYGS